MGLGLACCKVGLERNRSAVGKTANSLVSRRPQQLTPLPCGGPARLDPSLEPRRSAVLISALATGPPAGSEFRVFLYISKRVSMLNLGNLGRLWTTKSHAGDPY